MITTSADSGAAISSQQHPTLHWGAVFAGWFVATAIAGLLYLFGMAVGFSAFDPYRVAAAATALSAGAIVWLILTWGAALWIGSMFASWFDGGNDTEMGVVRGLTVWGLSVTATGLLIASGQAHFMFFLSPAAVLAAGTDAATVAHNTAAAMWAAFGSAVLGLLTSVFGGWMGAHHVHRVYHLRAYEPHLRR
jgi:hypothetical protein